MNEKTILTIDPKSLVRNAELETIVPMLSEEKFSALKYSISQFKVQVPVAIAIIDDKETVIDGYNRHKAVIQLMAERKLPANYEIPYTMLALHQLQDAKAYSIEMNLERRQLTDYQSITWALKVYDGIKTHKEVADFLKFKTVAVIAKVSSLNKIIAGLKSAKSHLPETVVLSIKWLQNGTVSDYSTTLKELTDAETVQTAIDVIDDDQLRAKMDAMFFDEKYTKPSKEVLESLNIAKDKYKHPEMYDGTGKDNDYYEAYQKFVKACDKALVKYPEKIDLCKVVAAPNRLDDIVKKVKFKIAEQDKKLFTIIFYEVPDTEEVS